MAAVGDFDRDGRDELAIVPAASSSRGNDLWVMKYFGNFPTGTFDHMSPIPNHQMGADIDCSSTKYPAKTMLVGNFDGVSPAILVAPEASGSRGNDFWVLEFSSLKIQLVNMIPNSLSGETGQDSEPNLTVNPANPSQMAGSAFTSNPTAGASTAPIFVSQDGGLTWLLNNIVPSQGRTSDITVRFATTSNNLYAGIIRVPGPARDILRTSNYLGSTNMT